MISPGGIRQLERDNALVVGQGNRIDVYPVLKSVRDDVLAQELQVLWRGLEAPGFCGPVASQSKTRRGADVRAYVQESGSLKPSHASQLKLIHHAGKQPALVCTQSEDLARHHSVGCADVETQAVRINGYRRRDPTQGVEGQSPADTATLSAEAQRPAKHVPEASATEASHYAVVGGHPDHPAAIATTGSRRGGAWLMSAPVSSHDDLGYLRGRWNRERAVHDDLALQLDAATLPATEPVRYDTAVLEAAGVGPDTRVLDLGCGQGDLTLALLARGAAVTGLDLSAGMVKLARRRVELHAHGRDARFVAGPVERTGLPSGSFDVIVGRWILHHVDLRPAAPELSRLLAPGGRAVFLENSGANPMLNFARDHVAGRFGIPRIGTEDERPLVADDWRVLERSFSSVRSEFPLVDVFELLARQVFRYRSLRVTSVCGRLDRLIGRSGLRRYSYRVLVVAEK